MAIELIMSGVQFGLKSQVWFPTKIASPVVQLPLYYIHFEIAQFNSLIRELDEFGQYLSFSFLCDQLV